MRYPLDAEYVATGICFWIEMYVDTVSYQFQSNHNVEKLTHFDNPSKVWIFGGIVVVVRRANRFPLNELVMINVTNM